jgi:Tol biopolymer transport system component
MKTAAIALSFAILVLLANKTAIAQNPSDYGKPRIFVADKDGSNVKLLVEIPEMASHGSPHWASDGKLILISTTPKARQYQLCKTYACAISGPFNGNVVEMGYGTCARFSPDMSRIAFHVHPANPDRLEAGIWVMRDDGAERKRLCDGVRPRWTPDSKSLVFISQQANGAAVETIYVDGTGRRPIVKETYPVAAAVDASPDGKEVCYIAYPERQYDGVLYRASLTDAAAAPKVVYRGRMGWSPAWSPDGRQILFWLMDENANRHLCVVDANGNEPPKKLANQEGTRFNSDAEWSPDGKRIIFSSDREFAEK